MGERGLGIRSGQNKQGWEQSDFPILCEICLGDNPYVRMLKDPNGKECKICTRPFTVFKWKSGTKGRWKKTEICQTCAKIKNVCQTCIFDLQYGLPVEVRDKILEDEKVMIPVSKSNRDFYIEQANRNITNLDLPYGHIPQPILDKIKRNEKNYDRNLPHICSFYLKGDCKRGSECPYRHEAKKEGDLANQNLKDRYYGKDDPLANKILNKLFTPKEPLTHPADKTVTNLIIRGVNPLITDADIRATFEKYGEIEDIKFRGNIADLKFSGRKAAETAITELYGKLIINNHLLPLYWKKTEGEKEEEEYDPELLVPNSSQAGNSKGPRPPTMPPPNFASNMNAQRQFILNVLQKDQSEYPSMNPHAMGGVNAEKK